MKLVAEGLVCARAGRRIFDGVSFVLGPGEALIVRGPNGAGKSSLLRLLAGLLPHAAGELRREGGAGDISANLAYVGHHEGIRPAMTVRENAAFWQALMGEVNGRSPDTALAKVGVAGLADIPAALLSAGQRRRLALARLFLSEKPLWLLDEPAVSLDREGVLALQGFIRDHLASGGLAVVATHDELGLEGAQVLALGGGGTAW